MTVLDLGITAAKRGNHDRLLSIMRNIIRKNPELNYEEWANLYWNALCNHEDSDLLIKQAVYNCAVSMINRCLPKTPKQTEEERVKNTKVVLNSLLSAVIIKWADYLLPHGKTIWESTFSEVAKYGKAVGQVSSRLAQFGDSGNALVMHSFKDKDELQEYVTKWLK
jgi:hypothetical protein